VCYFFNYNLNAKAGSLSNFELFEIRKHIESNFKLDSIIKREIFLNISHLKKIRTYKGLRHYENLPVRGQRTHTNAKTQKTLRRNSAFKKL
jgi:small subunit ribosomal protein S13